MGATRIRKQYFCPHCQQVVYTTVIRKEHLIEGLQLTMRCHQCRKVFIVTKADCEHEDNRGTYAP